MTPAWAQRKEELLSDCIVSPDVFNQMMDRLGEFVVPDSSAMRLPFLISARYAPDAGALVLGRLLLSWGLRLGQALLLPGALV